MKNLLLLLISIFSFAYSSAQTVCPDNLNCLSKLTVSATEGTSVFVYDLLENGVEFLQCDGDSVILTFSLENAEGEVVTSASVSQDIDCSYPRDTYNYIVSKVEILPDGNLGEPNSCWGELDIVDLNNVCSSVNSNYDVNVIVDCSNTDVVGIAGEFVETDNEQNICIDFVSKNFNNMASMQSGLVWNPDVLSFTELKIRALEDFAYNDNDAEEGEIKFAWLADLIKGEISLPDGEVLFEVCYDVIGNEGEYSKVSMVRIDDVPIELVKIEDTVLESQYCLSPAIVTVGTDSEGDFSATLNGDDLDVNQFNLMTVPGSLIKSGENTIEFTANKIQDYLFGVSTLDLVLGLKMFILDEPVSPLQAIALDVDYSGGINVKDLVYMRQLILGIRNELPHPGKFFLRANHDFSDDFDVFDYGYFNSFTFNSSEFSGGELFFNAYNYGDLSRTVNLDDEIIEVRSSAEKANFENKYLGIGELESVKFTIDGKRKFGISGLQLSIQLDDLELVDVIHSYSDSEFMTHAPEENILNILFAKLESEEILEFELLLRSSKNGHLADRITQRTDYRSELVKEDLSTSDIELVPVNQTNHNLEIAPNPFDEFTILKIPDEFIGGSVLVTDILGKRIMKREINDSEVKLIGSDFSHAGVYLISIEIGNQTITKKVVHN